jgi:hypothetical protein
MNPYDDDSLGPSLLLYLAALFGVLALVVVPVYLANKGTVQKNVGVAAVAGIARSNHRSFPLTRLKPAMIVDPALVAKLNAEAQKADHPYPADQAGTAWRALPPDAAGAYASTEGGAIGGPSSLQYSPVIH